MTGYRHLGILGADEPLYRVIQVIVIISIEMTCDQYYILQYYIHDQIDMKDKTVVLTPKDVK